MKFTNIEVCCLGYGGFPFYVGLASNDPKIVGMDISPERINRLEKSELMDSEINLEPEYLKCRKKVTADHKKILNQALN